MTEMLGYDATRDDSRNDPDVHYRLYWSTRSHALVVICVQDFDYDDYDDNCFVDYATFTDEADANAWLTLFLLVVARALRTPLLRA